MGDRTFHIRQVWSSAIAIEISDMGSETREKHGETMEKHGETMEKHGETMEKQGEAREKVLSVKRAKTRGGESGSRSTSE